MAMSHLKLFPQILSLVLSKQFQRYYHVITFLFELAFKLLNAARELIAAAKVSPLFVIFIEFLFEDLRSSKFSIHLVILD